MTTMINEENVPFFSVVIPIYNGLTHNLPRCMDSIWKQPIDEILYEVICVDDCSIDGTRNWLAEQKKTHFNLKILHNTVNIRQGGGRNRGMKAANGKYVVFIDQDDYFHENAFLNVYNHLQKKQLDLLIVDCTYEFPGWVGTKLQHNFPYREMMTGDEQIAKNSIPWAPWKFIFLRRLVVDNNLFFNQNERIEDIDWVHRLAHIAKVTQYQPILMIHYVKSPISTTMTSYCCPETVYSTLRMSARCFEMLDTTFKNSGDDVKQRVAALANFVFSWE